MSKRSFYEPSRKPCGIIAAQMKITFQNREIETAETSVDAFLASQGIDARGAIVELDGELLDGGSVASATLREGARLDAFRVVPGG